MMVMILSISLLNLAQYADIWTTRRALARGKREGNPLIAWAMRRLGDVGWLYLKLTMSGVVAIVAVVIEFPPLLWFATVATTLAALRNYRLGR